MQLPSHIRAKPKWFKFIPILNKYTANSLYPFIFIPEDVFNDLKSKEPNPRHLAILAHEEKHYERQKQMRWFTFGIKYLLFPKFRFNEELIAVKAGMKYLKDRNIPFDFEKSSGMLSSYLYLWPVSKYYAKKELKRVWDEI